MDKPQVSWLSATQLEHAHEFQDAMKAETAAIQPTEPFTRTTDRNSWLFTLPHSKPKPNFDYLPQPTLSAAISRKI